jgi:hypothetical protein
MAKGKQQVEPRPSFKSFMSLYVLAGCRQRRPQRSSSTSPLRSMRLPSSNSAAARQR